MQPREAAQLLFDAHRDGVLFPSGSIRELRDRRFAVDTAWELHRLRDPGRTRAGGWKIGYTSEAMRRQMGIDEPNAAPIYRDLIAENGLVDATLTHPRVEPEVSIQLATTVDWPALSAVDPADRIRYLADRTARIRCSLEVVDSVWTGYDFSWCENTADGSSGAAAVLGDEIPSVSMLGNLSVELTTAIVGDPDAAVSSCLDVQRGVDSSVLGNPLAAVAWLVKDLGSSGRAVEAGSVILTGGITASVALPAGTRAIARFSSGSWTGSVTASR